jgi:hypothetical protein
MQNGPEKTATQSESPSDTKAAGQLHHAYRYWLAGRAAQSVRLNTASRFAHCPLQSGAGLGQVNAKSSDRPGANRVGATCFSMDDMSWKKSR